MRLIPTPDSVQAQWSETSDTSLVAQALPAVIDLDVTLRKYHTVHTLLLGHCVRRTSVAAPAPPSSDLFAKHYP